MQLVSTYYPNWKCDDPALTVEAWHVILQDYEQSGILENLVAYVKAGERFAPSVGQLLPQKGRAIPTVAETQQLLLAMDSPKELPTPEELKNIFAKMDKMFDTQKG